MNVRKLILAVLCIGASGLLLVLPGVALAAAPPGVSEEAVVNVASSSATFQALVNPEGSETSYRFEYGTSEAYGASVPSPDGSAGAGTSALVVQAHTQTLQAHTTYHYRVLATNADGTTDGPDQSFTTQTGGGALALPDGRQWELVSPPIKDGARIEPADQEGGGLAQAAEDGGAVTYLANAPIETPAGNADESQIFSSRGAGGWSSRDIEPPHSEAIERPVGRGQQYRFFSSDLSLGIVQPSNGHESGEALLSPEASEYTVYQHHNADDASTGFVPLVTAANVPPGTEFKGIAGNASNSRVTFVSASQDASHIVVKATAALTSTPTENGLYEWAAGQLQLISILPDGTAAPEPELGQTVEGSTKDNARGTISNDGTRLFWESGAGGLYLRDVAKGETLRLDVVQGGSGTEAGGGSFQMATGDGSRVFFDYTQRLTADATSTVSSPDLYECEIVEEAGRLACNLTDLTVDEHAGESADAGMVFGTSEDGSYVYFMAAGALASGAAPSPCGCNLYVRHSGTTRFIAAISPIELAGFGFRSLTARVSQNGRYLAFMSDRSLTGYDNRDASSGLADEEVYLYDAASNLLACVSCNPTGARPMGASYVGASFIPGVPWPISPGTSLGDTRYQPRYLSSSGRLFFESVDALVAQDTNGTMDVYEYEPAGVGDCEAASVTFGKASGGCVGLISSGSSVEASSFVDASADGGDVFFMTTAQLASQDLDNAYDVYDAHACSVAVPCSPAAVSPPACTSADSCRAAPSSQPGVFGAPASATFSGAGNAVAPVGGPVVKPKVKAKRKAKHRHKQRGKRGKRGKVGKSTATRSLSARTRH